MKFLEEKFVPVAAAIASQKHLSAIRDGFIAIMPLSIAGAIAVLLNYFHGIFKENGLNMMGIYNGYENFLTSTHLRDILNAISRGSLDMLALTVMICIAYNMAKANKADVPIVTSAVTVASYFGIAGAPAITTKITDLATDDALKDSAYTSAISAIEKAINGLGYKSEVSNSGVDISVLNSKGLFVGMILALIVGEVFPRLSANKRLQIKLPEGVPPAVAASFSSLLPAIITVFLICAVGKYLEIFTGNDIWVIVQKFVAAPISDALNSMFTMIIAITMIGLLWTFGIHGASVVGSITNAPTMVLQLENTAAYEAQEAIPHNWPGLTYSYVFMGGSGATLGLIIAIFIFSKSGAERTIAKLSVAPGIFEINESITFGIPIVLNPIYMIPFIFGPVILGVISWILMDLNILGRCVVQVPWVAPPILIGFLATGGSFFAALWNAIELVLLTIWWTPFVMLSNKINSEQI